MTFPMLILPSDALEIINGALFIELIVMLMFTMLHLVTLYNHKVRAAYGRYSIWRIVRQLYYDNKPSIAIFVITFCLTARTGTAWWIRHIQNDGILDAWSSDWALAVMLAMSMGLIIGVACWIRNISPCHIPNWAWLLLFMASMTFGTFFAFAN
jgi:hypothetical protein